MLIGPKGHARKAVDEAIAVGAHQGHAIGGFQKRGLQVGGTGFSKTCGIDHRATAILFPQCPDDINSRLALYCDEGGIHRAFDLFNGFHASDATQFFALWVHRPDFPDEAKFTRARDGDGAFIATDEGDGFGIKEAGESHDNSSLSRCGEGGMPKA